MSSILETKREVSERDPVKRVSRGGGIDAGEAIVGTGWAGVLNRGPKGLFGERARLGECRRKGLDMGSVGGSTAVMGGIGAMNRDGSWFGAKEGRGAAANVAKGWARGVGVEGVELPFSIRAKRALISARAEAMDISMVVIRVAKM